MDYLKFKHGGPESFSRFLLLMAKFLLYNVLPNGKAIKAYGTHRVDSAPLKAFPFGSRCLDWKRGPRYLP